MDSIEVSVVWICARESFQMGPIKCYRTTLKIVEQISNFINSGLGGQFWELRRLLHHQRNVNDILDRSGIAKHGLTFADTSKRQHSCFLMFLMSNSTNIQSRGRGVPIFKSFLQFKNKHCSISHLLNLIWHFTRIFLNCTDLILHGTPGPHRPPQPSISRVRP